MLVKENILKSSKNTGRWSSFNGSVIAESNRVLDIKGGTGVLKAFYSSHKYLTRATIPGYKYSVSFYAEILGKKDAAFYILGLDANRQVYNVGFKGQVVLSGYKTSDDNLLQIQILTLDSNDSVTVKIDDIVIFEYSNILKSPSPAGNWSSFNGTRIYELSDGEVQALDGDKVSILKTYYSMRNALSDSLIVGEEYSISFEFENLREYPVYVYINGLDKDRQELAPNSKNSINITGKYVGGPIQLQVLTHNAEYYAKFRCSDIYVIKPYDDKLSRVWIPAKSDLPTNQQGYYPPDGDYNEIKAI